MSFDPFSCHCIDWLYIEQLRTLKAISVWTGWIGLDGIHYYPRAPLILVVFPSINVTACYKTVKLYLNRKRDKECLCKICSTATIALHIKLHVVQDTAQQIYYTNPIFCYILLT